MNCPNVIKCIISRQLITLADYLNLLQINSSWRNGIKDISEIKWLRNYLHKRLVNSLTHEQKIQYNTIKCKRSRFKSNSRRIRKNIQRKHKCQSLKDLGWWPICDIMMDAFRQRQWTVAHWMLHIVNNNRKWGASYGLGLGFTKVDWRRSQDIGIGMDEILLDTKDYAPCFWFLDSLIRDNEFCLSVRCGNWILGCIKYSHWSLLEFIQTRARETLFSEYSSSLYDTYKNSDETTCEKWQWRDQGLKSLEFIYHHHLDIFLSNNKQYGKGIQWGDGMSSNESWYSLLFLIYQCDWWIYRRSIIEKMRNEDSIKVENLLENSNCCMLSKYWRCPSATSHVEDCSEDCMLHLAILNPG